MAGGSILDPRWSPDGSRIAFVYVPDKDPGRRGADQQYAIYAIDLASQKISRLSP
jgi:Tol biopolymer transport system component